MQFPARFSDLPEYAFPRLRRLLAGIAPGGEELAMTIGEPQAPDAADSSPRPSPPMPASFALYPPNDGTPELRAAIAAWILRRYGVTVDPETEIIALNGTREGLFNAALALSPETKGGKPPVVLVPNPFYQAYGAGALAAGAELVPVPATARDRLPARLRGASAGAARPGDALLPLLAGQPPGRRRQRRDTAPA